MPKQPAKAKAVKVEKVENGARVKPAERVALPKRTPAPRTAPPEEPRLGQVYLMCAGPEGEWTAVRWHDILGASCRGGVVSVFVMPYGAAKPETVQAGEFASPEAATAVFTVLVAALAAMDPRPLLAGGGGLIASLAPATRAASHAPAPEPAPAPAPAPEPAPAPATETPA